MLDVAIAEGQVAEIGVALPPGHADVDVGGVVVTAGFVDLHSHARDIAGLRLQACDGVTTALELEAGVTPVEIAYRSAAAEGRPVNYGFAASWALSRMEAVAGVGLDGTLLPFLLNVASPAWQRPAVNANDGSRARILSGGSFNFSKPGALAFDGSHLWVANPGNNTVTEINPADGSWIRVVAGGDFGLSDPEGLAVAGQRIWVANAGANSLTVLPPG